MSEREKGWGGRTGGRGWRREWVCEDGGSSGKEQERAACPTHATRMVCMRARAKDTIHAVASRISPPSPAAAVLAPCSARSCSASSAPSHMGQARVGSGTDTPAAPAREGLAGPLPSVLSDVARSGRLPPAPCRTIRSRASSRGGSWRGTCSRRPRAPDQPLRHGRCHGVPHPLLRVPRWPWRVRPRAGDLGLPGTPEMITPAPSIPPFQRNRRRAGRGHRVERRRRAGASQTEPGLETLVPLARGAVWLLARKPNVGSRGRTKRTMSVHPGRAREPTRDPRPAGDADVVRRERSFLRPPAGAR